MADTAIVGNLGTAELAGAGVGTAIVSTVVGLLIFLAYATTPAVARLLGAGRRAEALAAGRDGLYVAGTLGIAVGLAGWLGAPWLAHVLGAAGAAHGFAVDYIQWSAPGVPAMLMMLAATGVFRGLQDTKTPLVVSMGAAGFNILTNFVLVYGAGLSVAGAAIGTSLTQWLALGVYLAILVPRMRADGVELAPSARGMLRTGEVGMWLVVRTAGLRAALLITVWVAARDGDATLAAHQIAFTLFTFLAFVLDALAIAAQALVGKARGAGEDPGELIRTLMRWSVVYGVAMGLAMAAFSPIAAVPFSQNPDVRSLVTGAVLVLAAAQGVAGLVFVLDGILIGAEDMRFLAVASLLTLAVYAPLLLGLVTLPGSALVWIWVAFAVGFLGSRALALSWRVRRVF